MIHKAHAVIIPRDLLFPMATDGDSNPDLKQTIYKRFPGSLIEFRFLSDPEEDDMAFFSVETPLSKKPSERCPFRLYCYSLGNVFPISGLKDKFVRFEPDSCDPKNGLLWSRSGSDEKNRDFFTFSPKTHSSKPIVSDFVRIITNRDAYPKVGFKVPSPGLVELWVNTNDTEPSNWKKILTDPSNYRRFTLTNHFRVACPSDMGEKVLFHFSNLLISTIDLTTGKISPFHFFTSSPMHPVDSEHDTWEFSPLGPHEKIINDQGLDIWTGVPMFNFLYQQLLEKIAAHLGSQTSFSVEHLSGNVFNFSFCLSTKDHARLIGTFDFATGGLEWQPPQQSDIDLEPYQSSFSEKHFGRVYVPDNYNFPESGFLPVSYYVSYPPSSREQQSPFPAVALVHGGPNARETYGFCPQVQHLTSRGCAVVQVNFRGSTNNAQTLKAGLNSHPDFMVKDVISVLEQLIKEGKIDRNNMAIMGGSYGGTAALLAATRNGHFQTPTFPGFKCAIASYPCTSFLRTVENLITIQVGPVHFPVSGQLMLGEPLPDPDSFSSQVRALLGDNPIPPYARQKLREADPLTHASSLSIPLIIMQGTQDAITPFSETKEFADLCPSEFLKAFIKCNEGHGWDNPANQRVLSYVTEAFLNQYLTGVQVEPLKLEDVLDTDMEFLSGQENFPEFKEFLPFKGWGKLSVDPKVLARFFPSPLSTCYPLSVFFSHEKNALMIHRNTLPLQQFYEICIKLKFLLSCKI